MKIISFALAALTLSLAACGGGDAAEEPSAGSSAAAPESGGMEEMPRTGDATADPARQVRAHLLAMRGAPEDSLAAMLPMHRQLAANLLARMNREMRQMNMTADGGWTATADSIRQDLTRMPEMGTPELRTMLPAHQARLDRLVEMHQSMMGGM